MSAIPKTERIRAYKQAHPDARNAEIAGRFDCGSDYVSRALHPETTARTEARRRGKKRDWEREHTTAICECGARYWAKRDAQGCAACRDRKRAEQRQQREDRIATLWHEGKSHAEIALAIGSTRNSVQVTISNMRAAGSDLPYRYPGWVGRPNARQAA